MFENLQRFGRRVRLVFRRTAAERSMAEELRYHLKREIEERVREGMSREEARRAALVSFGNVEAVKELARDTRGIRPLEDLAFDVR